jgi:hypothetical protein
MRRLCWLIMGWVVGAVVPAAAQTTRVTVVDSASREPIPGALISVRSSDGKLVVRALANPAGRAVVTLPSLGAYRVRADAIGYTGAEQALDLAAGSAALDFAIARAPLTLADLTVMSSRPVVCALAAEQGTTMARLWDEARKALLASDLSSRDSTLFWNIRTYQRLYNLRNQVVYERHHDRRGAAARPFVAVDQALLHADGYVQRIGSSIIYYAPDAELLLSEGFLDDHCFHVVTHNPWNSHLIGLGFEPTEERSKPEVKGVLWVDRASAELKSLDFSYVKAELPRELDSLGGQIEFTKLPSGTWFIDRWWIRSPRTSSVDMPSAIEWVVPEKWRAYVVGTLQSGGEASPARTSERESRPVVEGTVFDSTTMTPLEGAVVSLAEGGIADTTDSQGRYHLEAAGEGEYLLHFQARRFDLLGLPVLARAVRLRSGKPSTVDVAIPSDLSLIQTLCPADSGHVAERAYLVGQAVDSATNAPIDGQLLLLYPGAVALPAGLRRTFTSRGLRVEVDLSRGGQFMVCGLPADREVKVEVRHGTAITPFETLVPGKGKLTVLPLVVPDHSGAR